MEKIKAYREKKEYRKALEYIESKLEKGELGKTEYSQLLVQKADLLNDLKEYKKSLKVIEKIEDKIDLLSSEDRIVYYSIKIMALIETKALEEVEKLIEEAQIYVEEKCPKDEEYKQDKKAVFVGLSGLYHFNDRNYKKSIEVYKQAIELNQKLHKKERLCGNYNNLGLAYRMVGEYNDAISSFKKALEIQKTLDGLSELSNVYNNLGIAYYFKSDLDKTYECFMESLSIRRELGDKNDIASSLNNLAVILQSKGELDEALEKLQESMEIYKEIDNPDVVAKIYNNMGTIYDKQGKLNDSLEYLKKALELYEQLGNEMDKGPALFNMGNVYKQKGELNKALDVLNKCKAIYEEIDNKQDLADTLINIADVNLQAGIYDEAIVLLKQSLEISREGENYISLAHSYFLLIRTYLLLEDKHNALYFLEQFKILTEDKDNKSVDQMLKVCEALYWKKSKRFMHIGLAHKYFKDIVEAEILNHEVTVLALLNLCDMLLEELKQIQEEEIITELETYIKRLRNIAIEQNSYSLLAEGYWLEAQISLLKLDINQFKERINKAEMIAQEWGLKGIQMELSYEYDKFLDNITEWEKMVKRGATIRELTELLGLENLATKITRMGTFNIDVLENEQPVIFLIIAENGITLYSSIFNEQLQDDILIGGLISAINNMFSQVLSSSGWIERIKHKDFTMIFKQKDKLAFCYVFEGQSYKAIQKIETVVEQITTDQGLLKSLKFSQETGEEIDQTRKEHLFSIIKQHL